MLDKYGSADSADPQHEQASSYRASQLNLRSTTGDANPIMTRPDGKLKFTDNGCGFSRANLLDVFTQFLVNKRRNARK